ncbi:hypothetical protein VIBNISOn1_p0232 [Vibrio nigripulchritudo SOn1]|uniref:Integrase n=2 Tax=Vibrio nigripulchritudo TaxID=28173 RepID=A0AAV2W1X8_9VIBR|nr:hypothetical protein VIBNISOn1_p0232 [Vibrio nigripulchritudo SOn1]
MSSLSTFDATNKLIEMHSRSGAGLSENSHTQFSSSVRQFSRWCHINAMPSLPASVDTYLSFMGANAEHISISTMTIYTWAIRKLHLITGLADPTNSQTVKNAVASLKQRKVLMSETEQDQAIPIMNDEYLAAMAMLLSDKRPLGLRDAILPGLCWHTMLRQSEIVRIQLSHFHSLPNEEYSLEIPYTKTNKTGVSEFVTLPNYLIPLIEKHIAATGNRAFGQNAFLFIPLTRSGKPRQARMNQETQAAPSVQAETLGRKPRGGS